MAFCHILLYNIFNNIAVSYTYTNLTLSVSESVMREVTGSNSTRAKKCFFSYIAGLGCYIMQLTDAYSNDTSQTKVSHFGRAAGQN